MMQRGTRLFLLAVAGLFLGACADEPNSNPAAAQQTHGAPVDATDAIPAPAIAAEANRYAGDRVTVDGRIARVTGNGCLLHLATDGGPPLRVAAARTGEAACTWQLPAGTEGIAVATGTLRTDRDTLHLSAHGVQVTPFHPSD